MPFDYRGRSLNNYKEAGWYDREIGLWKGIIDDSAGLTGAVSGLTDSVDTLNTDVDTLTSEVEALVTGGSGAWNSLPTVARISNSSITVPDSGNTNKYDRILSRRTILSWTDSGNTKQAMVNTSSYSTNVVTLTLMGDLFTATAALTSVKYSIVKAEVSTLYSTAQNSISANDITQRFFPSGDTKILGADGHLLDPTPYRNVSNPQIAIARMPAHRPGWWCGCLTMSDDGTKIIVGEQGVTSGGNTGQGGKRLYISSDSGETWTETRPAGNTDQYWSLATCNSTATIIIVGNGARLYRSIDGGSTWNEIQPDGNNDINWQEGCFFSGGFYVVSKSYSGISGRMYKSLDNGATWTQIAASYGNVAWSSIDCSSDGSKVIATVAGGGVFYSSNGGTTFNETQPNGPGTFSWKFVRCSSDGTVIICGIDGLYIYLTTTGFSTFVWSQRDPTTIGSGRIWHAASMSADGKKVVVGDRSLSTTPSSRSGRFWYITDITTLSDYSWGERYPLGAALSRGWTTAYMVPDGSKVIVFAYRDGVYKVEDTSQSIWSWKTLYPVQNLPSRVALPNVLSSNIIFDTILVPPYDADGVSAIDGTTIYLDDCLLVNYTESNGYPTLGCYVNLYYTPLWNNLKG